jgi:hypothetical protein
MKMVSVHLSRRSKRQRGQALVEFSIAVIPFLMLLMGVFDLGRAIYAMNGTSEAAREIARVTSVHPCPSPFLPGCADLGSSTETANVVATQRGLIPGFTFDTSTDIECVDVTDTVIPDVECKAGDYIRVHVRAPFTPITPLVSAFGTHTFESYSRIRIP